MFSQPNWAALVVKKGSSISAGQLKGKKIAAQKGTDPYFFLLQVLDKRGLDPFKDVTIVNLAHADGKAALLRGDVDVWSGLDPITSQTVKIDGSKIIYENKALNTWGIMFSSFISLQICSICSGVSAEQGPAMISGVVNPIPQSLICL